MQIPTIIIPKPPNYHCITGIEYLQKEIGLTGEGVLAAFYDSGVCRVPGLQDNLVRCVEINGKEITESVDGYGPNGHGTATTSIAIGRIGVAPHGKGIGIWNRLTPRTNSELLCPLDDSANSMGWLKNNRDTFRNKSGVKMQLQIISFSALFKKHPEDPVFTIEEHPLTIAINEASRAGIIIVCPAGNEGPGDGTIQHHPSIHPKAITVGGVNLRHCADLRTAQIYKKSSRGSIEPGDDKPTLVAPAVAVPVLTFPGSKMEVNLKEQGSTYLKLLERSSKKMNKLLLRFAPNHYARELSKYLNKSPDMLENLNPHTLLEEIRNEYTSQSRYWIDSHHLVVSGTSFSGPFTTGVLMLLLEWLNNRGMQITPDEWKDILTTTCTPLEGVPRNAQGAGVINAKAAYEELLRRYKNTWV